MRKPVSSVVIEFKDARRSRADQSPDPQPPHSSPDATGRPAVRKLNARAETVLRQLERTDGDIINVARMNGVRVNDVARIAVHRLREARRAA